MRSIESILAIGRAKKINFLVLKQVYDIIESSYVDIIDLKA